MADGHEACLKWATILAVLDDASPGWDSRATRQPSMHNLIPNASGATRRAVWLGKPGSSVDVFLENQIFQYC